MEKTKTCRRGSETAAGLSSQRAVPPGLLPMSAFAMVPGQTASSWLGDQYVGSDGQHYYSPAPTPTWSTIPMGPWMYAPAPAAVLPPLYAYRF